MFADSLLYIWSFLETVRLIANYQKKAKASCQAFGRAMERAGAGVAGSEKKGDGLRARAARGLPEA